MAETLARFVLAFWLGGWATFAVAGIVTALTVDSDRLRWALAGFLIGWLWPALPLLRLCHGR